MRNPKRVLLVLTMGLMAVGCRSQGDLVLVPTRAGASATFAALDSKHVLQAALHYPKKNEPVQQLPMSLTASDGTGLRLVSLQAKAVVQGPLAFTELHLGFENAESRVREGRFEITLPDRAAISRLAMKLANGKWQEAEVVERQKARQVYEDFLHRKQDPALLEKKAGNQFRARVFPIPGRSIKEIKISYSQELEGTYRVHLKGLPRIDQLEVTAMVAEPATKNSKASSLGGTALAHREITVRKKDFAPDKDFEVQARTTLSALKNGNIALVRVRPRLKTNKAPMESLLMLVDTSASRAAGFYRQVERIGQLVGELKKIHGSGMTLHLACFDQVVGTVFRGAVGDFSRRDLDAILARRALGASNLHRALTWAGKQRGHDRLVLVSDGVTSAGEKGPALRRAAKALSVRRLDVVLVGGIRDEPAMASLARGTVEEDGVVLDGGEDPREIARRLSKKTVSGVKVAVDGARWLWPQQLNGVQQGDTAMVYVELAGARAAPVQVRLSGPIPDQQVTVQPARVKRPLLQRAWVGARIASLEQKRRSDATDPDLRRAIVKQIVELSTRHRVLSDHTALLVLETENDYARYDIKRTALAEILVVGAGGVELADRTGGPVLQQVRPRPQPLPAPTPQDRATGAPPPTGAPQQPPVTSAKSAPPPPVAAAKSSPAPPRDEAPESGARSSAPPPAPPPAHMRQERPSMAFDSDDEEDGLALSSDSRRRRAWTRRPRPRPVEKEPEGPPALAGKLAEVVGLIKDGRIEKALVMALRWRAEQPGDVMALVALGEALQANGSTRLAARVYGSIIDLFPSRADMRRFASQRLEALGKAGLELAADSYAHAVKQRPDHATGHRLLGLALVRLGRLDDALAALETGVKQSYRIGRSGVRQILIEDLGLVAAALAAKQPARRVELTRLLAGYSSSIPSEPSTRFVLSWETDANDVDFHIWDRYDNHAFHGQQALSSGGSLYADVTNGYGPECFNIPGKPKAFPYRVRLHYYSKGPMGYGMGLLQIVQHDGNGQLKVQARPFVVMNDRAYVDLGKVKGPI